MKTGNSCSRLVSSSPSRRSPRLTHPDAVCVQTGPVDGWYRQQFKWLRVNQGLRGSDDPCVVLRVGGANPAMPTVSRLCTPEGSRPNLAVRDNHEAERLCGLME